MFEGLDETMKHDEEAVTTSKERILRWLAVGLVSVLVFGGLYYTVSLLE